MVAHGARVQRMNPQDMIERTAFVGIFVVELREQTGRVVARYVRDPSHSPVYKEALTLQSEPGNCGTARLCALAPFTADTPHSERVLTLPSLRPSGLPLDYFEPSAYQWQNDMLDLQKRMLGALAFILLVTLVGIVGFSIIDPDAGFVRAFFMTAITLTTVGYGEEIAVDTDGARIFTAVLILFGMGATLYFVSTGTAFLIEGELGNVFRRKKMERLLAELEGHMIVCGGGPTAMYATAELHQVQRPVVLVCPTKKEAEEAASRLPDVPLILGDPTDDNILRAAGVERAFGLIACSETDNENVVITLTGRQLNPHIRIVSRLSDVDTESKVRKVGANAVVSPQHIGGLRLASELIRPTVVTFLDKMLLDKDGSLRIDEVTIPEQSASEGKAINELGLEHVPGVLLLAVRDLDGDWEYNPRRNTTVRAGTALIFLGSPRDSKLLRERLGSDLIEPDVTV